MTLKDYLAKSDETVDTFAARIGLSSGAIHKYVYGQREPSIATAERIALATDGAVSITDLAKPIVLSAKPTSQSAVAA